MNKKEFEVFPDNAVFPAFSMIELSGWLIIAPCGTKATKFPPWDVKQAYKPTETPRLKFPETDKIVTALFR